MKRILAILVYLIPESNVLALSKKDVVCSL
ncbi:Uncharacterised protein [Helicobacter cinaedi]|uniref:Uncharacterized protein n=1 Tax=Helicobacter cinaedi TaxID=213 RepID=A0A377JQM4_9HELI|nr:Uncharacterised protein [Helicobacter cinaedi]